MKRLLFHISLVVTISLHLARKDFGYLISWANVSQLGVAGLSAG